MKKILKTLSITGIAALGVVSTGVVIEKSQERVNDNCISIDDQFDSSVLNEQNNLGLENEQLKNIYLDMYYRYPDSTNTLKVENIKTMNDMNGNDYKLVEFSPSGYSIYNDNYSSILEVSAVAPSPFLNKNENLLYFGASNYYTKNHESIVSKYDTLEHSIDSNEKITLDENASSTFEDASTILNENLISTKNQLNGYNPARKSWSNSGSNYEVASIANKSLIKNADTGGFNTQGNCGFVAGALLIFYAANQWGWTNLYNSSTIQKSLVTDLQANHGNSTCAPDLEKQLNDYLNSHGDKKKAKVNMWHIPSASSIYDRVKEDKPVAIFGSLPDINGYDSINHAVTVYEVNRHFTTHWFGIRTYSDYEFRTHYGWSSYYNDVIISHNAISIGGMVNLHK